MTGFLDLHSHVLAGLDDGARALADGVAMLSGLHSIGFSEVFATPHQRAGYFLPEGSAIDAARVLLEGAREAAKIPIVLRLAAENMWDDVFFGRIAGKAFPRYDDGPAFLVEVPVQQLPPRMEEQLFEFRVQRLLPVLAHPERYVPLWKDWDRVVRLAESCALVVDLAALDGQHGRDQAKLARRLVEEGVAHACASDVHTPEDVRGAAAGIAWIKKRLGPAAVTRLLAEHPRRIVAGELPDTGA
jgi:protein-tyrosine phosphatase